MSCTEDIEASGADPLDAVSDAQAAAAFRRLVRHLRVRHDGQAAGGTKAAGEIGSSKELPTASSTAAQTSDDGSSPLVPILIAVAVLAAISIGAYYYRQRRQDSGSPISPKAS